MRQKEYIGGTSGGRGGNVRVITDRTQWTPIRYGQTTISNTATLLTAATPVATTSLELHADTKYVEVCASHVGSQAIRFRLDGVNPTTAIGHLLASNEQITLSRASYEAMRVIRDAATDMEVQVTQYR